MDRNVALRLYSSTLMSRDLESCMVLESATFEPEYAATRDMIRYRLSKASGLNIGLYTTASPGDDGSKLPTYEHAAAVQSGSDRRSVLVAHILATLSDNEALRDEDRMLPENWDNNETTQSPQQPKIGHCSTGRTVALHSLAVLPDLQRAQIGSKLLRGFIQMIQESKNFERIALVTWARLASWYESFGFVNHGKSASEHGGQEWVDMVLEFPSDPKAKEGKNEDEYEFEFEDM